MQLSEHFNLDEFIVSQTAARNGIDNQPTPLVISNLKNLCIHCLDPLRLLLGKSIYVSSGYRCYELNKKIGGAKNSQHLFGQAADISVKGFTPEMLYQKIINSGLKYDQLIQEYDQWVHISFDINNCRMIKMRAIYNGEKTIYKKE